MGKPIDKKGLVFGRTTVLYRNETVRGKASSWVCQCECGNKFSAQTSKLKESAPCKPDRGCIECRAEDARKFDDKSKFCPLCKETLPLSCFSANLYKSNSGKVQAYCRPCQRRVQVKYLYKLSPENHNSKLKEQKNTCGITGCVELVDTSSPVDHNGKCCASKGPTCGKCVRGILCQRHNLAIGLFKDRIEELQGAIEYLTKWNTTATIY